MSLNRPSLELTSAAIAGVYLGSDGALQSCTHRQQYSVYLHLKLKVNREADLSRGGK